MGTIHAIEEEGDTGQKTVNLMSAYWGRGGGMIFRPKCRSLRRREDSHLASISEVNTVQGTICNLKGAIGSNFRKLFSHS
jgi:hypothetical protein